VNSREIVLRRFREQRLTGDPFRSPAEVERSTANGRMRRLIVIDGHAVGSWKRVLGGRSVTHEASLHAPLDRGQTQAFEAAVERFARFLGLPVKVETRVAAA
jgi:winged helix DNA-binding protein